MSNRREYEIAFVGLKPGVHHYEYRVNDQFFVSYGAQDFNNCDATIKLSLEKNSGFMQLKFDIGGVVETNCDRCGNNLTLQLWEEFTVIVKMVDDPDTMNDQEEDPDIYYISRGESHLYVADWIFEFINLSIPIQKICLKNDKGESTCNKEVIEKLQNMENEVQKDTTPTIWKGLEKFKDLE